MYAGVGIIHDNGGLEGVLKGRLAGLSYACVSS